MQSLGSSRLRGCSGATGLSNRAAQARHSCRDLFIGAEEKNGSADSDAIAGQQAADLYGVAVDAGAVGAFQVGQDDVAVVLLNLGVEAADAFIIQAEDISLFAADGE